MLYKWKEYSPKVDSSVFLASGSHVIGNVEIGEHSSIWYNTVLRGDVFHIKIGKYTNIQDNTVIHVTTNKFASILKDYVTIGHNAVIHGATLEDYAYVGMSATILDEAVIEPYGFVAAGALVTSKTVIRSKCLFAGVPAKYIRSLHDHEIRMIEKSPAHYANLAKTHKNELTLVN